MGRRYIIDHVISALNIETKRERYENYIAESLHSIVYNTARQENVVLMKSYQELTAPKAEGDEKKEAENIINRIKNKLGGG